MAPIPYKFNQQQSYELNQLIYRFNRLIYKTNQLTQFIYKFNQLTQTLNPNRVAFRENQQPGKVTSNSEQPIHNEFWFR